MANWIKPEKAADNLSIVDLDKVIFVSTDIILKASVSYLCIRLDANDNYAYWSYTAEEDMLHDWNRIQEKLGLK